MLVLIALFVLTNLALVSIGLNIYQYRANKANLKKRPESLELREFLADLMVGRALLKIERVDGSNLFIQDPGR